MDNVRGSLSGLKHGIERRLERNKRKLDKTWLDGGEGRNSPGPSARLESQAAIDSDFEREGNQSNMDVESHRPSVAPDENKSGWKSTVSDSAKLVLRGVRDSADVFGPLKSIAGGLCFILENCEVSPTPPHILFSMLIGPTAHEGKQAGDRIAGTPDRCACRAALQARSCGGYRGARKEKQT